MYSCQRNHVSPLTSWVRTSRKTCPCTIKRTARKRSRSSARKRCRILPSGVAFIVRRMGPAAMPAFTGGHRRLATKTEGYHETREGRSLSDLDSGDAVGEFRLASHFYRHAAALTRLAPGRDRERAEPLDVRD